MTEGSCASVVAVAVCQTRQTDPIEFAQHLRRPPPLSALQRTHTHTLTSTRSGVQILLLDKQIIHYLAVFSPLVSLAAGLLH